MKTFLPYISINHNILCYSINSISENHNIQTHRRDAMNFRDLIERLAEMFPKQDYQSRLDNFIRSRQPKTASEVEYWQQQFERTEFRRLGL